MKRNLLLAAAIILSIVLQGCTAAGSRQEVASPATHSENINAGNKDQMLIQQRTVIIATGDMSGVYFPLGQALAHLFEKYDGAASGTQVTHASIQNMRLVSQKKAELGFSTVDVLETGNTTKPAKTKSYKNLRALTGLYPNFLQIIALKKSGIRTIEDLAGKRVSLGTEGSGTKIMAERTLQAAGLQNVQMVRQYLSFSQSADALENGSIDAAFFSSGLPNPEILSLSKHIPITLVPVSEEIVDRLHQEFGFYLKDLIPQGTYHGQIESMKTLSVKNVLLTYKTLSEKEAYELIKTLYEHVDELKQVHSAAENISISDAGKGIPLEFHPGALKYLKEKGIAIDKE